MERKPIAPLNTAAAPPATNVRGWNKRIARYDAVPPGSSILGMDIIFDMHHAPHMNHGGVLSCHSTTGQDTSGCSQSTTENIVIHSDSCGLFVDEDAFEGQCDLALRYTEAAQCLVDCESVLGTLTERLASKDKHIVHLESKLVEMSFELASLKAFADEHRSKRRSSFSCGGDDTVTTASCSDHPNAVYIRVGDNATSRCQVTSTRRHSIPPSKQEAYRQERSRWSRSLESLTWEGSSRTDDLSSDAIDEFGASFSALPNNISQFFRKKMDDMSMEQVARRPPNTKRVERQAEQHTSITSLEGVVFPSSYEA